MEEKSTEELKKSLKTLQSLVYVLSTLIVLYLIYFTFKIITDKWSNENVIAGGMMAMLGAVISIIGTKAKAYKKEIRQREKEG